jgi:hypothetical protein
LEKHATSRLRVEEFGTEDGQNDKTVFLSQECHLTMLFLDPEDIKVLGVGVIWNFVKGTGLL